MDGWFGPRAKSQHCLPLPGRSEHSYNEIVEAGGPAFVALLQSGFVKKETTMKRKEIKRIRFVFAIGLGLTLFAVCASAQREPSTRHYTITDLGTLGGSSSSALAINNEGQVVGRSTLPGDAVTGAFLWQDGTMTDLGSLGGTFSTANGINRAGDVVGASELPNNTARHAVLFRNGQVVDLGALPQSGL